MTTNSSAEVVQLRPAPGHSALAITADQDYWTERQIAALRQLGAEEAGEGDLAVFFHQATRTGLDPFARQIYLIGRRENRRTQDGSGNWVDNWGVKYTIQTGIDGLRLIARRASDAAREHLSYEDTLWCGPDGRWRDVWIENTPPAAAKVTVLRDGDRYPAVALFREYAQTTGRGDNAKLTSMWARMPANQLAKCAEALALRKAFPQDLSGIYSDDEMGQADQRAAEAEERQANGRESNRRPVQAQATRVVEGEAFDPEAEAAIDAEWLARIDALGSAEAARTLYAEVKDHGPQVSLRRITRDGDTRELYRWIEAKGAELAAKAKTAAAQATEEAADAEGTGPASDVPHEEEPPPAVEPVEGEVIDAPKATVPPQVDPEDMCRNTAQRRAVLAQLAEIKGGAELADIAIEGHFQVEVHEVSTKRLREYLTEEQRKAAHAQ